VLGPRDVLCLLDANVLIDANRDYYPIERIPEFWDWLEWQGSCGAIKVPVEIYEEVKDGSDDLAKWIKSASVKKALLHSAEVVPALVDRAVSTGYAPDLTDVDLLKLGCDPFLLAYALSDTGAHCIVTTEVSKPSRVGANRHLPDVARGFGIPCCNTFQLTRLLNFRTNWRVSRP
jgi:hypothetical protein